VPRRCTVCDHPERAEIDSALARGVSPYDLVAGYSGLKRTSIQRHAENHIPDKLLKAQEVEEVAAADDLLADLRSLQSRTLAILEAAEGTRQHRTGLSAIAEARRNLELLAKLVGKLNGGPTVNLIMSPAWVEVRGVIVGALEPHPKARVAVAEALREIEGGAEG